MGSNLSLTDRILRLLRYDWPCHFCLLFMNWLPDNGPFLWLRGKLVGLFIGSCGRNLRLARNITIYNPRCLHVGNDVFIANGCWIGAITSIYLDDEVMIGPYTVIISSNHTRQDYSYRFGEVEKRKIVVGKGAWIAAHVVLTAGARVGIGTIVAANSVVVGVLPDHVLAAGSPAKIKKDYVENV